VIVVAKKTGGGVRGKIIFSSFSPKHPESSKFSYMHVLMVELELRYGIGCCSQNTSGNVSVTGHRYMYYVHQRHLHTGEVRWQVIWRTAVTYPLRRIFTHPLNTNYWFCLQYICGLQGFKIHRH